MPIYEYRRPDGTTFEVRQSFSDEPLAVDPESGVPVERVLHAPAVHFKGKGFYSTDYGSRNRQRETAAAAEGSSKSDASSGGDSSSKEGSSGSGEGGKGAGEGGKESGKGGRDSGKGGRDSGKGGKDSGSSSSTQAQARD
jgi:putative FmdB family regulatory protein